MKIAVCIKRVPDMETRFKIAANGTSVDEAGLKYDMSDFDGYAVETALQLNEKQGPGETVVISLGPDVVQEQLRKALSMGADRAVQLKADRVPADGLAIAQALAAELKGGGYDLILFGQSGGGLRERDGRSDDRGAARPSMRDGGFDARHRERARHGASRARGSGGDGRVSAAGGGERR